MRFTILAGMLGAALALTPAGFAQDRPSDSKPKVSQPQRQPDDMQRAIEFQRAKDRADARQERLERRHPSVDYSNADRSMEESTPGQRLKDPGPGQGKKDKNQQ